ncbi:MAG: DUF2671 domain-containing protein [Rickettsiales bacterium]
MSIVQKLMRQIPELADAEEAPPFDRRYVRKLSELTGSALQKNCDVMQLSNGDVVVAEIKTVFYTYRWDDRKGKFLRSKNVRKRRMSDDFSDMEMENDVETEYGEEEKEPQHAAKKSPARRALPEFAE